MDEVTTPEEKQAALAAIMQEHGDIPDYAVSLVPWQDEATGEYWMRVLVTCMKCAPSHELYAATPRLPEAEYAALTSDQWREYMAPAYQRMQTECGKAKYHGG